MTNDPSKATMTTPPKEESPEKKEWSFSDVRSPVSVAPSTVPSNPNTVDGNELLYCQEVSPPPPNTSTADGTTANSPDANACVFHEPAEKEELEIGDHVYQWRSLMGIPGVFQHHGIVMDIQRNVTVTDTAEDGSSTTNIITKLTIADFSNVEKKHEPQHLRLESGSSPLMHEDNIKGQQFNEADGNGPQPQPSTPKQNSVEIVISEQKKEANPQKPSENQSPVSHRKRIGGLVQEGILRTYTDTDKWHKVEYKAPLWKRTVYRAGTCTAVSTDAVGLVLARVNFILGHPDILPNYHVLNANCECVAVWCKTGRWATLQASSFLEMTAAGQVKSSATLAATAATAQVTVATPASGLWGWLGYTTTSQVSWLSLHPVVIPALAGYAVLSVGAPAVLYVQARKEWSATTERLQEAFWGDAMENPEVFAECMTHWSDKH